VSYFSLVDAQFPALATMSEALSEAGLCQYAIVEFLVDIHHHLPPYWYILEGDDLGSVDFLFGCLKRTFTPTLLRGDDHRNAS